MVLLRGMWFRASHAPRAPYLTTTVCVCLFSGACRDRFGSGSASSRERFDGLRHKARPRSLTWRQALPGAASARPTALHRGRSWIAVNRLRQEEQIQIH